MNTHYAQALEPSSRSQVMAAVDRWIWVFMAVLFIALTLTGFVPDSLQNLAMIRAGARPPFPPALHVHAVLMGSFLLLLVQSWLMATGRRERHMWLGRTAFVLVPAIIVTGFVLVPTIYRQVWNGAQAAPSPVREQLQQTLLFLDNIALLQLKAGVLFTVLIWLALRARRTDSGFHKRMMFLATAWPLQAAIDRITWLPSLYPGPLSTDLYTVLAVSPLLLWDAIRQRSVPRVYVVWLGVSLPVVVAVQLLWDAPAWHAFVPQVLGP